MSLLGQEWFGLSETNDAVLPGLLATRRVAADPALQADWTTIYLELATGFVDTIWVIVPVADDRFELARGAVYSYYEFRWPSDELRLTDEEWRSMLDDAAQAEGPVPVERPSWQAPFLLGATISDVPVPQAQPR